MRLSKQLFTTVESSNSDNANRHVQETPRAIRNQALSSVTNPCENLMLRGVSRMCISTSSAVICISQETLNSFRGLSHRHSYRNTATAIPPNVTVNSPPLSHTAGIITFVCPPATLTKQPLNSIKCSAFTNEPVFTYCKAILHYLCEFHS
jgi:hypothetical protein